MRRTTVPAMIAVLSMVASACSGTGRGNPEAPAAVPTETVVAGVTVAAADTTPQAASAPVVALPPTVTVVEPDFVIDAGGALEADQISLVEELPGLLHAARVAKRVMTISGPAGDTEVDVLVVDPEAFRPLTPEATAQAVGVWERLVAGEVVVRHDVAHQLELELGGQLLLAGEDSSTVTRIGAFAANGTPPIAAVVVPWSVGRELGIDEPTGFIIAVEDDEVEDVEEALGVVLGSDNVERRTGPTQLVAQITSNGSTTLESFTYTDLGDGTIAIDPDWVARNIVTVELPGIATTKCNRVMVPQLLAALDEVRALGLYDHFKPEQFGGCYYPRHIDWSPEYPLSNHAWGIAVDFNTHDNWLGEEPMMDLRIVEVFEKWGFEWGGWWRRPDGMHFELARIVTPG